MKDLVKIGNKIIDREKFEPRAKKCSHCSYQEEVDDNKIECKVFGWLIDRQLAKKQAVCSRTQKPTEITVTSGDKNDEKLWSEMN